MQLLDRLQIVLSKDNGSNPQSICFKKTEDTTDTALLLEYVAQNQPFPVATTVIPFGTITTGKWLYFAPTADADLIFNGGSDQITVLGGKTFRAWLSITALSVVVTGAENVCNLVLAGE